MTAILKKELWTYFGSWSAWIILGAFSLVSGLFLFFFENDFNIFDIGTASLQSFFTLAPWIFLFIIPALTMRSVAEEEQNGTLGWLFSQPIKIFDFLMGKFLSVWIVGSLCLIPSLVYFYTVYTLGVPAGNLDTGMAWGSYLGIIVLVAGFAALGIFSSAIAKNQVTGYLIGLLLNFIFWFGFEQLASYQLMGNADYFIQNLGFQFHFNGFARGLIDSKDVFYFAFIVILCLSGAKYFVQKKK